MPDADRLAEVGHLGQVFADVVVERELAILREKHDGGGGELLRHRSALEDGRSRDRHLVLEIRRAVAPGIERLTITAHANRASRRFRPVPWREDLIDAAEKRVAYGTKLRARGGRHDEERGQT